MAWRGSTTVSDRIFACLAYFLPLLDLVVLVAAPLSGSFLSPLLALLAVPLAPLFLLYGSIPFASLIVFFALYLLVVRNESIPHFIRFNTMQALLFSIALSLIGIIWSAILAPVFGMGGLLTQTLFNAVFLGTIAAIGYSLIQSALGRYAEIPTISDAVHMQVR
ncbi:MAG: hypothetical protein KME13_26445 [Myxacorys californica WJT36-NPBG1]|jgi:uncharacterized membrane protein|nr:hypothetical protein [Myxacorys californica WJT36-NPBG1]